MAVRADLSPARLKISFLQTYLCSETERSARRGHSVGTPREDTPRGHPAAAVRCGGTRRLLSAGAVIGAAAPRYRRARAVGGRQLRGDRRGTPRPCHRPAPRPSGAPRILLPSTGPGKKAASRRPPAAFPEESKARVRYGRQKAGTRYRAGHLAAVPPVPVYF